MTYHLSRFSAVSESGQVVRVKGKSRCGGMADATDLKSVDPKGSCGFESRHRHTSYVPKNQEVVSSNPMLLDDLGPSQCAAVSKALTIY